jgi:hypothetical protein
MEDVDVAAASQWNRGLETEAWLTFKSWACPTLSPAKVGEADGMRYVATVRAEFKHGRRPPQIWPKSCRLRSAHSTGTWSYVLITGRIKLLIHLHGKGVPGAAVELGLELMGGTRMAARARVECGRGRQRGAAGERRGSGAVADWNHQWLDAYACGRRGQRTREEKRTAAGKPDVGGPEKKQKTIKLTGCVGLGVVARAKCEGGWFGYSILFGTQGTV